MSRAVDTTPGKGRFVWPVAVICGLTLWRVAVLAFSQVDPFMDEAQYWLWGQDLAGGYYSKPPLIGWVIRASTELGGSDAPFWIRLPSQIAYGIGGLLVMLIGDRLWPGRAGAWAGPVFVSLPGVSVLAMFASTDDLLLPLFALALLAWLRLIARPGATAAVALGAAVGLGMLAKYAMFYFVGLAGLAWLMGHGRAVPLRHWALALAVAIIVFLPNVLWNLSNGLITLTHTAENAGWEAIRLGWDRAAEFVGVQFLAFGPVFGVAFLWAAVRPGEGRGRIVRLLLLFSATLFLAVAVQALIRHANGNWAAPAFVAGAALAGPWLYHRSPRWFAAGLALNLAVAGALPLATVWPEALTVRGANPFERTMGVRALSEDALSAVREAGLGGIAAGDRMILADLVYRAKGTGVAVYAWPVPEVPDSHYALTRALPADAGPVLYVARDPLPRCGPVLQRRTSAEGPERIRSLVFQRLRGRCGG